MKAIVISGWLLIGASVMAGLYSYLGLVALKHLRDATDIEKTVGWTLWWFLEVDRYDEVGKKICRRGSTVLCSHGALPLPGTTWLFAANMLYPNPAVKRIRLRRPAYLVR